MGARTLDEAAAVAAVDQEAEQAARQRSKALVQIAKSDARVLKQRERVQHARDGSPKASEREALCREIEQRDGLLVQFEQAQWTNPVQKTDASRWKAEALRQQMERERVAALRIQRTHHQKC